MKTISFEIRQQDIACGKRGKGTNCPAAYGLLGVHGVDQVYCGTFWSVLTENGLHYNARHSQKLSEFIQKFDDSGEGEPGVFTVELLNQEEIEALKMENTGGTL